MCAVSKGAKRMRIKKIFFDRLPKRQASKALPAKTAGK